MKLIASNISKNYNGKQAVHNVSIEVQQGEIISLLGPNGAGKTTCFYMILGLITIDSGKMMLNDQDITAKPVHIRAKLGIGYLPQDPSIFRKLSVENNILAILQLNKKLSKKEQLEKTNQLLEEFNLIPIRKSMAISLSGGERRRLEIARTLATQPKFILLDEPFAGVDPISIGAIKSIIQYLANKGIGVIITDHNVREILGICHRAYIMHDGRVISVGSPQEILTNKQVRQVYLGDEFNI